MDTVVVMLFCPYLLELAVYCGISNKKLYLALFGVLCVHLFNLVFWRMSPIHGEVISRAAFITLHYVTRKCWFFFSLYNADG